MANFLSNKEILAEIHKSKNSFCFFVDPKYCDYDIIIDNIENITPVLLEELRIEKIKEHNSKVNKSLINGPILNDNDITFSDIVFRVMCDEHIPNDENKKLKIKTNFPPFKHYIVERFNGAVPELKEVVRSHWKNGFQNGEFSQEHGNITDRLARMFLKLVERYGQKPNWRSYSYLEEMKNQSLLQLVQVGLKFDESRSQNPFAYYTTVMTNSFTGIFHKEKRNQVIRDDIRIMQGQMPSNTRQVENEMEYRDSFADNQS